MTLFPQANECRELTRLDGIWSFRKDPDGVGESERWFDGLKDARPLAVPGSWNDQAGDLYHYLGKAWYERAVFVPADWKNKHMRIRIGSVFYRASIWINGVKVGDYEGGSLPIDVELNGCLKVGEQNRVTILVDSTLDPWSLPPAAAEVSEGRVGFFDSNPPVAYDFYPYSGIHRSVFLYALNEVHVQAIAVETDVLDRSGIVSYIIELSGIVDGELRVSSSGVEKVHKLVRQSRVEGQLTIPDAKLWDVGRPNLYDLCIELDSNGSRLDRYNQSYGIRTILVQEGKVILNGKPVFFKGFGKHEDFCISGRGTNSCVNIKDFDLMEWMGANSFRTSHYPYAEEIYDLADRLGILIIGETPFVGLTDRLYTPEILDKSKEVIKKMIERDRNHPSVVMWSLANEPNVDTKAGEQFFGEMLEMARAIDGTRPITYVAYLEPENNLGMERFDVVCVNKYYGWYLGPGDIDKTLPDLEACLRRFYDAFGKPIILTEFGADAVAGMHSEPPQMFSEEFQRDMILTQYALVRSLDFCIGAHIWNFADFKTAQSITRVGMNRKGVFTRERQPKLAAHAIRKVWNEERDQ